MIHNEADLKRLLENAKGDPIIEQQILSRMGDDMSETKSSEQD